MVICTSAAPAPAGFSSDSNTRPISAASRGPSEDTLRMLSAAGSCATAAATPRARSRAAPPMSTASRTRTSEIKTHDRMRRALGGHRPPITTLSRRYHDAITTLSRRLRQSVVKRSQAFPISQSRHLRDVIVTGAGHQPEGLRLKRRREQVLTEAQRYHCVTIAMHHQERRMHAPDFRAGVETPYQRSEER